jgi:predicted membrane channel-forming protein YqfA (hemolysin III family)
VVFSVCYYSSLLPLTTYNALFVPIFAMAGLLCLVMSALFHQAAEMKAESDLTI